MGAHETAGQTLAAVEADAIRLRAAVLRARFDDAQRDTADPLRRPMTSGEWCEWGGAAAAVLAELARG